MAELTHLLGGLVNSGLEGFEPLATHSAADFVQPPIVATGVSGCSWGALHVAGAQPAQHSRFPARNWVDWPISRPALASLSAR